MPGNELKGKTILRNCERYFQETQHYMVQFLFQEIREDSRFSEYSKKYLVNCLSYKRIYVADSDKLKEEYEQNKKKF